MTEEQEFKQNMDKLNNNFPSINREQFEALIKARLSLDELFILFHPDIETEDVKILGMIQGLMRKGYLNVNREVTELGEKLMTLDNISGIKGERKKKVAREKGAFDQWWETFPSTDSFNYKSHKFEGLRSLRVRKDECAVLFDKLIQEFDTDKIIEATKIHIEAAKTISFKKAENQLTYIPNSYRYLSEKRFEPYIGKKLEGETKQIVNIKDLF